MWRVRLATVEIAQWYIFLKFRSQSFSRGGTGVYPSLRWVFLRMDREKELKKGGKKRVRLSLSANYVYIFFLPACYLPSAVYDTILPIVYSSTPDSLATFFTRLDARNGAIQDIIVAGAFRPTAATTPAN